MIAIIDFHYASTWSKHDIFGGMFYNMKSVGMIYYHSVPYRTLGMVVLAWPGTSGIPLAWPRTSGVPYSVIPDIY